MAFVAIALVACHRGWMPMNEGAANGWSTANRIEPSSADGAPTRLASVATTRSGVLVVGNHVVAFDEPAPRDRMWSAFVIDGALVPPPPGHFTFLFPKAVADERGRLQLLWAEPADRSSESVFLPTAPATAIWASRLDSLTGWTTPQHVADGAFQWDAQADDQVASDGELSVAVVSSRTVRGGVFVLLSRGAEWTSTRLPGVRQASYTSIAVRGNAIAVLYIAGEGARDVNSVFVIRSDDAGHTWSEPHLVSRSGESPAFHGRIRASGDGTLHLVWEQSMSGERSVLRHVAIDPSGAASPPADIAVPGRLNHLSAVLDRESCVHAVFDLRQPDGGSSVAYARWNGRWLPLESGFAEWHPLEASVTLVSRAELLLTFVANDRSAGRLPGLMAATRSLEGSGRE